MALKDSYPAEEQVVRPEPPFSWRAALEIIQAPPQRGDIVVFNPTVDSSIPYVKRVAAVAGDTIEVKDGKLYVNGAETQFPGAHGVTATQSPSVTYPLTVQAGEFFALGDNRQFSSDSRSFGPQPDDRIIGKVILRFWPFDRLRFFAW